MVEKDELAEAKKAHRLITNYVELLEKKDPYQEYYVMDDQGNLIRKS